MEPSRVSGYLNPEQAVADSRHVCTRSRGHELLGAPEPRRPAVDDGVVITLPPGSRLRDVADDHTDQVRRALAAGSPTAPW